MPPVSVAAHVIGYLMEIGPVLPGPAAITHQELSFWQQNTGVELQPWQARFIRALSQEYVAEMHRASEPDAKAPWQPEDVSVVRATVSAQVDSFMDALTR